MRELGTYNIYPLRDYTGYLIPSSLLRTSQLSRFAVKRPEEHFLKGPFETQIRKTKKNMSQNPTYLCPEA